SPRRKRHRHSSTGFTVDIYGLYSTMGRRPRCRGKSYGPAEIILPDARGAGGPPDPLAAGPLHGPGSKDRARRTARLHLGHEPPERNARQETRHPPAGRSGFSLYGPVSAGADAAQGPARPARSTFPGIGQLAGGAPVGAGPADGTGAGCHPRSHRGVQETTGGPLMNCGVLLPESLTESLSVT